MVTVVVGVLDDAERAAGVDLNAARVRGLRVKDCLLVTLAGIASKVSEKIDQALGCCVYASQAISPKRCRHHWFNGRIACEVTSSWTQR